MMARLLRDEREQRKAHRNHGRRFQPSPLSWLRFRNLLAEKLVEELAVDPPMLSHDVSSPARLARVRIRV